MKNSSRTAVNLNDKLVITDFGSIFKNNNRGLSTKAFYRKYIQVQCLQVWRTIKDIISGLFT